MTYFVYHGTEDGPTLVNLQDKDEVNEYLKEHELCVFRTILDSDANYWDEKDCLIISGAIIQPHAKQVITEWDFPRDEN